MGIDALGRLTLFFDNERIKKSSAHVVRDDLGFILDKIDIEIFSGECFYDCVYTS